MKFLITNVFIGIHIILNIFIACMTIPIVLSYVFMDFYDDNVPIMYKIIIVLYLILMGVAQLTQALILGIRTSFSSYFKRLCMNQKLETNLMFMGICKKAMIIIILHFAALFFMIFFISVYVKYYNLIGMD